MYYKTMWRIVKQKRGMFCSAITIAVLLSLLPLFQSVVVQGLVTRIQEGYTEGIFAIVFVYVFFLFVLPIIFREIESLLNKVLDYTVKTHMVEYVYGKACKVPIKYFENGEEAGLLHRGLDVNASDSQTVVLVMLDIGMRSFTMLSLTIRYGGLGMGLFVISFVMTLLSEGLEYKLRGMDYAFWRDMEEQERFCQTLGRLLMEKKSVLELYAYGARQGYVEKLYKKQQELDGKIHRQNRKKFCYSLYTAIMYCLRNTLLYALVVLAVGCSAISPSAGLGLFAIVGSYGLACSHLIQGIVNLRAQKFYCKEFDEMLALPEEQSMEKEGGVYDAGVVFEEVSYQYPNSDQQVLSGISFSIKPGEKIAVVGDNGAGKSTLIRLLMGLDEPTSGEVSLYSAGSGKKYAISFLREKCTIMLQNFCKYPFTVRENMAMGDEKDSVEEVVARLDLQEMVARMPNQLETEIISEGILSGGEWQMVALGRAYMKGGSFVILDEPTAAIDAKRELWLYQKFLSLIKGYTAVIVSHRLPVCQICDRIIVMQSGKIIEAGTHEELLEKNGYYAKMYEQQSEMYV